MGFFLESITFFRACACSIALQNSPRGKDRKTSGRGSKLAELVVIFTQPIVLNVTHLVDTEEVAAHCQMLPPLPLLIARGEEDEDEAEKR